MNETELWKSIFGYEGRYMVSNYGNIRRCAHTRPDGSFLKDRILKPQPRPDGYMIVMLYAPGSSQGKWVKVHKIVAETFLGERPHKFDINHKDGEKSNNQLSNLEYCTRQENMRHAYATKLHGRPIGVTNGRAKLTEQDVHEVWRIYHEEGMTQLDLAELFDISPTVVGDILHRRTWRHLNLEASRESA